MQKIITAAWTGNVPSASGGNYKPKNEVLVYDE